MATKIAIIGMGLIGSSIGLALKKSKGIGGLKIVGHDREPMAAKGANRIGAMDSSEWNMPAAVRDASMVILSTPVVAMKEVMETIAPHLLEGCVVTDTGSTKADVMTWAEEILPSNVSFVGGHPLAGKEASGPDAAESKLFENATYCIIPSARAKRDAVQSVIKIVKLIGATPFFIDVKEHDSFVAAVSHLPLVLSSALVASTTKSPAWHEMARLAASGYRDLTRLASGDPEMNRDICLTNAKEIAPWLDRLITELLEVKRYIEESNDEALTHYFLQNYQQREKWMAGVPLGPSTFGDVDIPSAGEQMGSLLFGQLMSQKAKALLAQYEKPQDLGRKKY